MEKEEKIIKLKQLQANPTLSECYEFMEDAGDIKTNYNIYFTQTERGYDIDGEFATLESFDYERCTALMTLLFREDRWLGSYESTFEKRIQKGQVGSLLEKMINLLSGK